MIDVVYSTRFKKDLKLAERRGYNIDLLKSTIEILANQQPLPEQYLDHPLSGEYKDYRECHIRPDWLLIYRYDNAGEALMLLVFRTGTHSDLF